MGKEKQQQLDFLINQKIQSGEIPGFMIGTKTIKTEECFCYGTADPYTGLQIGKDTIFRLYSMSKPICAVAVWILIERGKLDLDSLLLEVLPEFKNIVRYTDDGSGNTVPVQNPIKIRNLLNMTAGITYDDIVVPGRREGQIFESIHRAIDTGKNITTREAVRLFAELPLAAEPGEAWRYGLCADVLGAVIEAVDGRSLGEFYEQEIFEPLGMKDTGFYIPQEKQGRFAPLFKQNKEGERCRLEYDCEHHLGLGDFLSPPAYESAGAGLVSTYNDYMKFAWMLASCGISEDGVRILKPETVKRFAQNQLTPAQTQTIYYAHMPGYGYGNLMRVCLEGEKAKVPGTKGSFGWDGWCGPYMTVDIHQKKVLLYFLQISAYSDWEFNGKLFRLFLFD